ncbi:type 1 glutamine amidotransferase [Actinokineospora diospyrosa]|uniref:GMP synthase - Glutamine amidotransferase n=1 Tax=Actinokineospora diospyrosa TaxID=103728 RepID=A0ABT1IA40_9PSEU|nr:type 1 glutamine amidotransferase [Actinokineospora diospyrosa]MCP2269433.1 GMP synthase - Glutamine amidotransferase [Actinokineospora diospyrosa]
MTSVLVVQLDDTDPPGRLVEWLADAGADIVLAQPYREPLPMGDYAAVVCLGGPMGANDVIDHPWLAEVRKLLSSCVSKKTPLLAICLGAQLLAVATGGIVEVGANGPEVGGGLVAKRDVGWVDPLFADLPMMPDVVQFHHDVVTRLPVDAALLASATRYPNQAFRVGPVGYGIQFHIETTPELVLAWAANAPESAAWAKPGELEPERLVELHADVEEAWRPFVERFMRLAKGELAPVEPSRPTLPLI